MDRDQLLKIKSRLPSMDFFQILNVKSPDVEDEAIKDGFRKRSQQFHPDRFFRADPEIKELVSHIYKQVAIAYNALKTQRFRMMYKNKLEENREENLRYNPARAMENPEKTKADEKQTGPGAKYYELAEKSMIAKNRKSTLNNIKLALMMEKDNPVFIEFQKKAEEMKK